MKTSNAGIQAIRNREGCRLIAYKDTVGVWTIGVGHTGRASAPLVTAGMTISQAQADQYLANDLVPFEKVVNDSIGTSITQNQFDALVSLSFNIGGRAYENSTVAKRLRSGSVVDAGAAILMWNKPTAIIGRRKTEYNQFFNGVEPTSVKPVTPVTPPVVVPPKYQNTVVTTTGFWQRLIQAIINLFKRNK